MFSSADCNISAFRVDHIGLSRTDKLQSLNDRTEYVSVFFNAEYPCNAAVLIYRSRISEREDTFGNTTSLPAALYQFYEKRIPLPPPKTQESFQWSSYKKVSQRCYTLCLEIMVGIKRGIYPVGSKLPALHALAGTAL